MSIRAGKIEGTVKAQPSKSHMHRALVIAALCKGTTTIRNPCICRDTMATIDCLRKMGAIIDIGDDVTVTSEGLRAPSEPLDAGNSGTTLRFMSAIASLFDSTTVLKGDASLMRRPMAPLLDSLSECGAVCDVGENISIKGGLTSDRFEIDPKDSSQFVSALLMISPLMGASIDVKGKCVSKGYVRMTLEMMQAFGVDVLITDSGFETERSEYMPTTFTIPADYSSASYMLVANALGADITIEGLGGDHPDSIVENIILDATSGGLHAMDVNLSDNPDLFPIIAVLLSTAEGVSRIYGAPHLRSKESDRIATTSAMLNALGADVAPTDDGCIIRGVEKLHGGYIEHHGDHRVMMSAAIASMLCDGPVTMDDDGCWEVSYPDYVDDLVSVGFEVERCTRSATG